MGNRIETTSLVIGFDQAFVRRFKKTSLIVGVILVIVGLAGAALPQVMSLVSNFFIGWLMVMAGVLAGYIVFLSKGRSMIAWLKAALLLITGALFLFNPKVGIAALALLLGFYLLLDALASLGLAHDYYPLRGWGWLVFNGLLSLTLALLVFLGWPASSALWVGIFVGISLLVDGLVLIALALAIE